MSALGVTALALAAAWLLLLTVVVALVVRQIGLVTIRLDRAREQNAPVEDGLAVGAPVPQVAAAVLPQGIEPAYLLILAATCQPCRELAEAMHDLDLAGRTVAIISGPRTRAAELAGRVPDGIRVTTDPEAGSIVDALEIMTTPFAFEVRGQRIGAKAVLRGAEHFASFVERSQDATRRPNPTPVEVTAHAQ